MTKGKSGSIRVNSLSPSDLSAMEAHEQRRDRTGPARSVRKDAHGNPVPPLIFDPYGVGNEEGCFAAALAAHTEGAKVNKGARKVALHAFVQFPTDLEITPETEEMMLRQAVEFIERHHGDRAVFRARLDRDEEGRHGVDVFYAPRYEKHTKRRSADWISLTKFGKELAIARFGQKAEMRKNDQGEFEPVLDASGDPVMKDCDSSWYQGQALQDLFHEHLRDQIGLDWVERGTKKVGSDPDRVEVEEYKIQQDREKVRRDQMTVRSQLRRAENDQKNAAATQTWLARAAQNIRSGMSRALNGTHSKIITPDDMDSGPKFTALKDAAAAEDREPTFGFRARFWTLNFNNGKKHPYFDDATRKNISDAFDRIDEFATANQKLQEREKAILEREKAVEARIEPLKASEAALRASVGELEQKRDELDAEIAAKESWAEDVRDEVQGISDNVRLMENLDPQERVQQMDANYQGVSWAVVHVLEKLNIADEKMDVGYIGPDGDPPPIRQLIFSLAKQRTEELIQTLHRARSGPSGPSM